MLDDPIQLISLLCGALGIAACVSCYQFKTRRNILIVKFIADVLWATHYFLLGAYTGFGANLLCGVRETVYLIDNNEKRRPFWLIVFMLAGWGSAAITWNGFASLMPVAATTAATYSFWQKKPVVTKIIALSTAVFMLVYDICVLSVPGLVNESLTIISVTIALIHYGIVVKRANEKKRLAESKD